MTGVSRHHPPLPWISIVVPTIGRPTLARMLASVDEPGVEVIIVADTYNGDVEAELAHARMRCSGAEMRPRIDVRWADFDAGYHAWGHPQRNEGMRLATAPWLMFSQDDNQLAPGALRFIRERIRLLPHLRPMLFQVDNWQAGVVWKRPVLAEGNIDADCIVTPNVPDRLARWTDRFNGDFDFIMETCRRWFDVAFVERVIARSPEKTRGERERMAAAWTREAVTR